MQHQYKPQEKKNMNLHIQLTLPISMHVNQQCPIWELRKNLLQNLILIIKVTFSVSTSRYSNDLCLCLFPFIHHLIFLMLVSSLAGTSFPILPFSHTSYIYHLLAFIFFHPSFCKKFFHYWFLLGFVLTPHPFKIISWFFHLLFPNIILPFSFSFLFSVFNLPLPLVLFSGSFSLTYSFFSSLFNVLFIYFYKCTTCM